MKFNKNLKKSNKSIIVKFYYENDKLLKEESELIDEKEAKKYASLNLIVSKQKFLIVGLGKKTDLTNEKIRRIGANVYQKLKKKAENAYFIINKIFDDKKIIVFFEGVNLSAYKFDKYKTKKEKSKLKVFSTDIKDLKKFNLQLSKIDNLVKGVFMIRDLVNEPANILNPTSFEAFAKKVVKSTAKLKMSLKKKEWVGYYL